MQTSATYSKQTEYYKYNTKLSLDPKNREVEVLIRSRYKNCCILLFF